MSIKFILPFPARTFYLDRISDCHQSSRPTLSKDVMTPLQARMHVVLGPSWLTGNVRYRL